MKLRSQRTPTYTVFILRHVTDANPPMYYVVDRAFFRRWRRLWLTCADVDLSKDAVIARFNEVVQRFVSVKNGHTEQPAYAIDAVIPEVKLRGKRGRKCHIQPVFVLLNDSHAILPHKHCQRLSEHPLDGVIPTNRRFRPKNAQVA